MDSGADPVKGFFPRGAIAFFAAMSGFYVVFWFAIYLLMAYRQ